MSTACAGSATHPGEPGHLYTLRLTASDNVGNEVSTEAQAGAPRVTKYYYHGGRRVAMRAADVVYYLHADHLGSASLATTSSGAVHSQQRYYPYGDVRWSDGTLPTDFTFTGQRSVPGTGLVFMHARYYHPALGRFVSADTIVPNPGNPQDLNRCAYVRNNPVLYRDPSGHAVDMYRNSIYGVVDDPLAEPPSPEKVRETVVFMAAGVGFALVPEVIAVAPKEYVVGAGISEIGYLLGLGWTGQWDEFDPVGALLAFYVGGLGSPWEGWLGDIAWGGINNAGQYALSCLVKWNSIESNVMAWTAGTGILAGGLGKATEEGLGSLSQSDAFRRYPVVQQGLRGAARTVGPIAGDVSAQQMAHSLRTSTTGSEPLTVSPQYFRGSSPASLGSSGTGGSQMNQSPYVCPWLQ